MADIAAWVDANWECCTLAVAAVVLGSLEQVFVAVSQDSVA